MNEKAFFLDLDGTLLNDKREITDGNRAAIKKALDAGHKIIISTGRPLVSALEQAKSLGLTMPGCYLIAFNGGILYNTGSNEIIFKTSIPLPLVRDVFAHAKQLGVHIQTYDDSKVLAEPCSNPTFLDLYCQKINMTSSILDNISLLEEEPVKMLMIDYDTPRDLELMRRWISEYYSEQLDTFFSCREYVEIVPKGLNKGTALLRLAEHLQIPHENTIAVGDAENDSAMIKKAHTGVCMCNGSDSVKAIADYITENDNNHDGIAEVICKYTGITL